jgi:hypothetical protein
MQMVRARTQGRKRRALDCEVGGASKDRREKVRERQTERDSKMTPRAKGRLDAGFLCGWLKVMVGTAAVLALIGAAINVAYYYFTGTWLR